MSDNEPVATDGKTRSSTPSKCRVADRLMRDQVGPVSLLMSNQKPPLGGLIGSTASSSSLGANVSTLVH